MKVVNINLLLLGITTYFVMDKSDTSKCHGLSVTFIVFVCVISMLLVCMQKFIYTDLINLGSPKVY